MEGAQPSEPGPGPNPGAHGAPREGAFGPGHPKHDQHQYGQFVQLVQDMANGKADPSRIMGFLEGLDAQFWKGALVGVAAVLLLTNDTVKSTMNSSLSGLMGVLGGEKKEEQSAE